MAEHPDDFESRIESMDRAATYGPELISYDPVQLRRLVNCVLTYSDQDAAALLSKVREWFWGGALHDAERKDTDK